MGRTDRKESLLYFSGWQKKSSDRDKFTLLSLGRFTVFLAYLIRNELLSLSLSFLQSPFSQDEIGFHVVLSNPSVHFVAIESFKKF